MGGPGPACDDAIVLLEIRAHTFPGRAFFDGQGLRANVHVGVQEGRLPVQLVPGDADQATWEVEVRVIETKDGARDFRGPCVQGKKGDRFVYLVWGDRLDDVHLDQFRRAKLMLDRVEPSVVAAADAEGRRLVATVCLTDGKGGPVCARVDPPAIRWTAE